MDINHIKDRNIRSCECRCGAVNLVCRGEPQRTSVCHCYECQKRTGSVFGVQARFPIEQVTLSGEVTSFSRISDTGNEVTYQFLPQVWHHHAFAVSCRRRFLYRPARII